MKRITGRYVVGSLLALGVVLDALVVPAMPALAAGTGNHIVFNNSDATVVVIHRPEVTSVRPTIGIAGQTLNVVITGHYFIQTGGMGPLYVNSVYFGEGITVNGITVNSATMITANVTISRYARPGFRDVSVSIIDPHFKPNPTGTLGRVFLVLF